MTKKILWLASWYPNQLSPFNGDFIQRHARSVSIFKNITVIHVTKDEKAIITRDVKKIISTSKNLTEIIVFYHSFRTGFPLADKILSALKYKKVYQATLKKYLKKNGTPDIVHLHVALKAGQMALWLKKKYTIPYIISEHWSGYFDASEFNMHSLNIFQKKLLKNVFNNANKLIVVSDVLGKAISKHFWRNEYTIIYNTVDTTIFYPEIIASQNIPTFIHISSLNYEKNPTQIIEACFLLKSKGYLFKVEIFGPSKNDLKKLVSVKNLEDNITFKNEVPQKELAESLKKASALILFSHFETFGCVVIEANACGVPAILSDLPVFKEYMKENISCIFAKSNDAASLAEKMEGIILHKYHFDKKKIADETAATFSYPVIGKQLANLY